LLTIFKASAGSGKTFALTMEVLKLLFNNPGDFEHFLAITFTNKATEEMKSRLIAYLDQLAGGSNDRFMKTVMQSTGVKDMDTVASKAQMILHSLLYNYSGLHIQTIDSFFQQVVRRFARESGIHIGYNVDLDTSNALAVAVDNLFEGLGETPVLEKWLTGFALQKIETGKSWNFRKDTLSLAYEIFSEKYMEHEQELLSLMKDKSQFNGFISSLNKEVNSFENTLAEKGKKRFEPDQKCRTCNQ